MKHVFDYLPRGLQNYLGLAGKESSSGLQEARGKTQLVDVQRRIRIYLNALWGRDFVIKPADGDPENHLKNRPFIRNSFIHVPDIFFDLMLDGVTHANALEVYRAACTHAAAHIIFSKHPFHEKLVDKWQRAVIAAIEDARVETLSIREFPGLKLLWAVQHTVTPLHNQTADDYLSRLARALLDEDYQDDDPWISRGRSLFNAADDLERDDFSWDAGLTLAEAFRNRKAKFTYSPDKPGAPYRDDNRYIWESGRLDAADEQESTIDIPIYKLLSTENVVTGEVKDKKQPLLPKAITHASASDTYIYSEWDYRSQINTPSWVTLREREPQAGDLKIIEHIIAQNRHLITRMKNLLLAIQDRNVRRIRKQEEGDDVDINAAVRAMTDIRMGILPDERIMMRTIRKTRDTSVLVLLDLSGSANQKVHGQDQTVLQLTQKVCVLFAEAIGAVGDPLAIHGFNSRSRHDVDYFRFKNFDRPYDDVLKSKIAGMAADRSTRMGAAIRHATYCLNEQKSGKKLLMIITDGAPSDVDMPDRKYLRHDAKHAVNEARKSGIHTYCIVLDPKADVYVSRIFGARNFLVVDHVKSLPEKMLLIYAALTI